MKKITGKVLALSLSGAMLVSVAALTGCGDGNSNAENTLRIYNCYEYIDETLLDKFETEYEAKTGEDIEVEYSCFDTPEDCYNSLKIDGSAYDLICPSDYMIEKMAREGMLEEIELPSGGNYMQNVSPFIKETFESITFDGKSLANYAAGYMWGTLGLVYDSATVDADDMNSWSILWGGKYDEKFTIKDSVRDTYFIGLARYHADELEQYRSEYLAGGTLEEYQSKLKAAFNDTSENTVNSVKDILMDLKSRSWGMEVDDGKDYIIRGETQVYFAWSGDAVYAMDEAESEDLNEEDRKTLCYSVPEEGSNIWFDGWCVPKGAVNKDLALEFIDFLSRPDNVIANMEYIGYCSCIAGDEIFEWVVENYGVEGGEYSVDLGYFFGDHGIDWIGGDEYTVTTDTVGRQFSALYPEKSVLDRCVVMNYFPDADNERINNMWSEIKIG